MNHDEKRIVAYFQKMNLSLDERAFDKFTNREKHKIQRLCERMVYLYEQIMDKKYVSDIKKSFFKEEFRALEWIMWEFELIPGEKFKKLNLEV